MHTSNFRAAAAAFVAFACAAAPAVAGTPAGAVVFTRTQSDATLAPRARTLWLLDIATAQVRPLTMSTDRVFDMAATWAPDGRSLVFDRGTPRARGETRHLLESLSLADGRVHALLPGAATDASKPAWGPGNRIAFIAKTPTGSCVALVDGQGRNRRNLLCAPAPNTFARPTWSPDGARLFVAGGAPEGRLEPIWHARVHAIDVASGSATLLSDIAMEAELDLQVSPDGTRGIYSDIVANDMTLVNFATGAATTLPRRGSAPRWSPDGKRIAFTGEVYEVGEEFRYYEPLYVMNADGTRIRRITDSRVDNHAYTAAQWSKDNIHLLVNRRTFDDVSLTIARYSLRIVDADTRALVQLPAGFAEAGGWYEP
jgi:Tol biopolymer transport system component